MQCALKARCHSSLNSIYLTDLCINLAQEISQYSSNHSFFETEDVEKTFGVSVQ